MGGSAVRRASLVAMRERAAEKAALAETAASVAERVIMTGAMDIDIAVNAPLKYHHYATGRGAKTVQRVRINENYESELDEYRNQISHDLAEWYFDYEDSLIEALQNNHDIEQEEEYVKWILENPGKVGGAIAGSYAGVIPGVAKASIVVTAAGVVLDHPVSYGRFVRQAIFDQPEVQAALKNIHDNPELSASAKKALLSEAIKEVYSNPEFIADLHRAASLHADRALSAEFTEAAISYGSYYIAGRAVNAGFKKGTELLGRAIEKSAIGAPVSKAITQVSASTGGIANNVAKRQVTRDALVSGATSIQWLVKRGSKEAGGIVVGEVEGAAEELIADSARAALKLAEAPKNTDETFASTRILAAPEKGPGMG